MPRKDQRDRSRFELARQIAKLHLNRSFLLEPSSVLVNVGRHLQDVIMLELEVRTASFNRIMTQIYITKGKLTFQQNSTVP